MHAAQHRTSRRRRPRVRGHAGGLSHQKHHSDLRRRDVREPGGLEHDVTAALQGQAAVRSGE